MCCECVWARRVSECARVGRGDLKGLEAVVSAAVFTGIHHHHSTAAACMHGGTKLMQVPMHV